MLVSFGFTEAEFKMPLAGRLANRLRVRATLT
jgi:hypothetical protein